MQGRETERTQAHVQQLNQQIGSHAEAMADQIKADSSLPNLNRFSRTISTGRSNT